VDGSSGRPAWAARPKTRRAEHIDGADRPLASALEEISLCAALREKGAPSLTKALMSPKK
jgi:hypothetical protein